MDHYKTIEQLNLFLQGLPISIYIIPFILHAFSCVLFIQYKTKYVLGEKGTGPWVLGPHIKHV